jgi:hypothetical protein
MSETPAADVIDAIDLFALFEKGKPLLDQRIRVNGRVLRFGDCTGKDLDWIIGELRRKKTR